MHIINMSSHALGKKGKCMQYKHLHYVYIFLCKVDYNNDKFSKVPPYTYNVPSVCANFLEVVVFLIKKICNWIFNLGQKKKKKKTVPTMRFATTWVGRWHWVWVVMLVYCSPCCFEMLVHDFICLKNENVAYLLVWIMIHEIKILYVFQVLHGTKPHHLWSLEMCCYINIKHKIISQIYKMTPTHVQIV